VYTNHEKILQQANNEFIEILVFFESCLAFSTMQLIVENAGQHWKIVSMDAVPLSQVTGHKSTFPVPITTKNLSVSYC